MTNIVNASEFSNDSLVNSASANETGISRIFNYNGSNVTFKMKNGTVYVNMTDVAKSFPTKNLTQIVNSQEIKDYCEVLAKLQNYSLGDLLIVIRGGNKNGTWAHQKVALRIAQKLSTEFAIWVDTKLEELLTTGKTEIRTCVQPQTKGQELVLSTFSGIDFIANALRMNDVSKVALFNKASKDLANKGIAYIPAIDYVDSKGQLLSATELLKRNQIFVSVNKFNGLMMIEGFLEDKTRPSSKGGVKHFKSLTDKGLEFGENQVSPHNPRETQPLYYEGKFRQLLSVLKIID